MTPLSKWFMRGAEFVAAMMMAAMFLTFILQIAVRYTARLQWLGEAVPFLDPSLYGWTLEFCLALWVWVVFWGNAFIVRERDHVTFDMLYLHVNPAIRKWFAIISGLAIFAGLLWSLEPTWDKFYILRLKKTATLKALFGDSIRMRDIYSIYIVFLGVVSLRYGWRAWVSFRHGAETDLHHHDETASR
ncbi:TRAP transporter small permease [Oricola cellulosilytica]|uniref:TRAP transporter small permease protein n=1 Tax=Oricola cellulosilytica TaxID=1429082 RepID=A0A4R0PFS7_9HYPH|nr:TRAP transporter small permease subunit [Oricola cellulosilytica]TCD16696.1 TRAP transporter small permease subunit [Oricola cellulosilytica]